ncbi:amyloid protein-binding protein 2 [Cylas formicarius]|uniref:amyloid protein-binding protein 2 n=1 Tax=Cylas formicarius TaxID=197179 RepID=UPI002958C6FF|nr:amyloid protein-binding protein 2 [Cylas formicarius]
MPVSPPSLYQMCLTAAVGETISFCKACRKNFRILPNNVLLDYYYTIFSENRLCLLASEFADINVFDRLLYVKQKRCKLLKCFQTLIDHGRFNVDSLIQSYIKYQKNKPPNISVIDVGLRLAYFLNEGGWYVPAIEVLKGTETMCQQIGEDDISLKKLLETYQMKIYAESQNCQFSDAEKSYKASQKIVAKLEQLNSLPNLTSLYSTYSLMYFIHSEYNEAYAWSEKALENLSDNLPLRVRMEVLSQASKSCVIKRYFNKAGLLIRQAVNIANFILQTENLPCASDVLLDYAFYLLNYDSIEESVDIYKQVLKLRSDIFDKYNIKVALAHEDLAYALYVCEYSSGNFFLAREHVETSISIMEKILVKDHLMLASVKRVKALILEEIALDEHLNTRRQIEYLKTAESLHKAALELSYTAFGEKNVQTAKHFGNLGRLYQSMRFYDEAEQMHQRAIAIKEELLGKDDYEVGLSVGHLASLFNYHMKRYDEAEKLYLRSIEINLKLFGEAYSGLEYDYRGLIHVYTKLLENSKVLLYNKKMREWKLLRKNIKSVDYKEKTLPAKEIILRFFEMKH